MWVLGHLAIGFFSALVVSSYTGEKFFLPLVFFLSLLPDLDEFSGRVFVHRGPTHSIVLAFLLFLPFFLLFNSGYVYFAALASHSLLGDFFIPSKPLEKLFWPFSRKWFGASNGLQLFGRNETIFEVILFTCMLLFIFNGW